jgi:hypothetical protein
MDPVLAAYMREDFERRKKEFYVMHEVFVLAFEDNPIKLLGLSQIHEQNQKFVSVQKEIRASWPTAIWHLDYFKSPIHVKYSHTRPPSKGRYFWYLVLSVRQVSEGTRDEIRTNTHSKLQAYCQSEGLPVRVLSQENAPKDIDYHYTVQEMYSKLTEPPKGARRPNFPSYDSIEETPIEKAFEFPQGRITVQQFQQHIRENAQFLANDVIAYSRFLRQEDREYKFTREEDLPLDALLRHLQIEAEAEVELGREGAPIDFKITRSDGTTLLVEVTQALPKNGHLYRQAIVARPFGLPLHERTRHQVGKDTFPDPIIDAISAKHKIGYLGNPILLVFFLGDYTDEDDYIINLWVQSIKHRVELGAFSSIFLVELARRKVIELFRKKGVL